MICLQEAGVLTSQKSMREDVTYRSTPPIIYFDHWSGRLTKTRFTFKHYRIRNASGCAFLLDLCSYNGWGIRKTCSITYPQRLDPNDGAWTLLLQHMAIEFGQMDFS